MPSSFRLGLTLIFIIFPFVEIAVLIKVGQIIGFWPTLLILMASAFLGLVVIRQQGMSMVGRMMGAMNQGRLPLEPMFDTYVVTTAGFLLIMPGLISDVIGLLLLIPPLRRLAVGWALGGFAPKPRPHEPQEARKSSRPIVIEGTYERIDDEDDEKDRKP